jgi:hypothetical protein
MARGTAKRLSVGDDWMLIEVALFPDGVRFLRTFAMKNAVRKQKQ